MTRNTVFQWRFYMCQLPLNFVVNSDLIPRFFARMQDVAHSHPNANPKSVQFHFSNVTNTDTQHKFGSSFYWSARKSRIRWTLCPRLPTRCSTETKLHHKYRLFSVPLRFRRFCLFFFMCSFGVAIKRTEAERTVPQAYFYVLQEQYLDWCVYFALYGSNSKRSEQKSTEAWILFFCVVLAEFSVCIFHSVYRISTKALEILFDFPLRAQVEFNVNLDFCFFLLFFCAISFSHYFFFFVHMLLCTVASSLIDIFIYGLFRERFSSSSSFCRFIQCSWLMQELNP